MIQTSEVCFYHLHILFSATIFCYDGQSCLMTAHKYCCHGLSSWFSCFHYFTSVFHKFDSVCTWFGFLKVLCFLVALSFPFCCLFPNVCGLPVFDITSSLKLVFPVCLPGVCILLQHYSYIYLTLQNCYFSHVLSLLHTLICLNCF